VTHFRRIAQVRHTRICLANQAVGGSLTLRHSAAPNWLAAGGQPPVGICGRLRSWLRDYPIIEKISRQNRRFASAQLLELPTYEVCCAQGVCGNFFAPVKFVTGSDGPYALNDIFGVNLGVY
jgi:hypothetical protein